MTVLSFLGRWQRRQASGAQDERREGDRLKSVPFAVTLYGQAPRAQHPAASGVTLRRSPAPPGGSRRGPGT